MPRIIVQTEPTGDQQAGVTLTERLITINLESEHYRAQLVDRILWATADAEVLEADATVRDVDTSDPHGSPSAAEIPVRQRRSPARRARPARVGATAALALATAALSLGALSPTRALADGDGSPPPSAAPTASSVALKWYDITSATVTAAAYPEPVTQSRTWSVSWLAAARAVGHGNPPDYATAAFAQAVHDTLVAQVPSQTAALDGDLAATLADLPDSARTRAGVAAGQLAAAALLADRQGDGLDTSSVDTPFTPPAPGPGIWQPTPAAYAPAVRAGEGDGHPFVLTDGAQFDPGPPPALSSPTYLGALTEVRSYGSATSTVRTPQQTDTALFWEPAANIQYVQVLRAVLADTHRSLAWQARFVAAFNVVTTDAQISVYHAKFKYLFWRPVTAIRTGAVEPDPTWTPLFTTPPHPDWPSGHGGFAGAAQQVLTAFIGREAPEPIAVTSPTEPGSVHTYDDWRQITDEVINARVWEGIHFRFSDIAGARLGGQVARYDLRHLGQVGL